MRPSYLYITAVVYYIVAIIVAAAVEGDLKMWALLPLCLAVVANEAAGRNVSAAQALLTVAIIVFVAADGAQKAFGVIPLLLSAGYVSKKAGHSEAADFIHGAGHSDVEML